MDRIAKALVAAMVAGLAVFDMATSPDSVAGAGVTSNEWVRVVLSALTAGLLTWAVPNKPDPELLMKARQ